MAELSCGALPSDFPSPDKDDADRLVAQMAAASVLGLDGKTRYTRTFLHPGAASAYKTARAQGHRVTGLLGDLTQLGGLFIVKPPAVLVYAHKSRYAGDHPDMGEVLAKLQE